MSAIVILITILAYFGLLVGVSFLVGGKSDNDTFFKGNKTSPWYIVAFGMIGASLSGVTFISVPGAVEAGAMNYFQVVLGYIAGYAVIALVLLPLYYRLNLTSIYSYLEQRYGNAAQFTGSTFFIISRVIGASFRLYLVAGVLQTFVFNSMGIAFWQTVTITVALIWVYTFRTGIKTIIWTDTLQTLFMLVSLGVAIYFIANSLKLGGIADIATFVVDSDYSQIFFFDDWKSGEYFWKQFFAGMFITIVMTGLDQDMMQKNLTCRSLKDAQKNMFWFTIVLTVVNLVFLVLGVLLTVFAQKEGITAVKDDLFPTIAINGQLGWGLGLMFILGLIAAAYSSADSALTSLTTSFSVDILKLEGKNNSLWARTIVHISFSIVLILVIVGFNYVIKDASVINKLFVFAGYTYGPLLGLFSFGILTKLRVKHFATPFIAVASPFLAYLISNYSEKWFGFEFGFFVLLLNGFITFLGLFIASLFNKQD